MKALETVGQAIERLRDREDQRREYIHRRETSARKDHFDMQIQKLEGEIKAIKALRIQQ